jgi:hypothetical protein
MSAMPLSVDNVLEKYLPNFDDDLRQYICSVLEEMSLEERRSHQSLVEAVAPFIVDSGYADEQASENICRSISVAFGGSGYKGGGGSNAIQDDTPILLSAPVKIIDNNSHLKNIKATYGGAVLADAADDNAMKPAAVMSNSLMDASAIPTTQKQLRKMRKENEQLQKILRSEAATRAAQAAEISSARMAAIKASRAAGRQSLTGVKIERLSLPHPSGTGDLLADASLVGVVIVVECVLPYDRPLLPIYFLICMILSRWLMTLHLEWWRVGMSIMALFVFGVRIKLPLFHQEIGVQ